MIPQDFLKAVATEYGVTDTELTVLSLAMKGESSATIAKQLGTRAEVIRNRMGEVYRKFRIPGAGPGKLPKLQQILVSQYQAYQATGGFYGSAAVVLPEGETERPRQDWGEAPDVSIFYGRAEELETLGQWIVGDRCRLVALLGMAGIGKTTLSVKLAREIEDEFEYIIWRSLRNAPTPKELLADLIHFLSGQPKTYLPEKVNDNISLLIEFLKNHRCLLIVDDVEEILRSGDRMGRYIQGYEDYGVLLRRVGQEQHQSCLLLCTQEKPKEIALLENTKVNLLQLTGLKQENAREILQEKGLSGDKELEYLINYYGGNPQALKIVSVTIRDVFNKKVAEFIEFLRTFFGDYRELLDLQFERLSILEKEVMQYIAVELDTISFKKLKEKIPDTVSASEFIEALASLAGRSLIEKVNGEGKDSNETFFTLQPVIKKYVAKYHSRSDSK